MPNSSSRPLPQSRGCRSDLCCGGNTQVRGSTCLRQGVAARAAPAQANGVSQHCRFLHRFARSKDLCHTGVA
eukprot:11147666-Alexandrium_andersonii.AAC.1